MNIHGIQYPVMLVILFAYLAESIYEKKREKGNSGVVSKRLICIIVTCYTIFLTPHFTNLLAVPFTMAEHSGNVHKRTGGSKYQGTLHA